MSHTVKLLILDVDGTLTDSSIFYGNNSLEIKAFSTKDGAILKCLPELGIRAVIMTGRTSEAVRRRGEDLNCIVIQGIEDKKTKLCDIMAEHKITASQTAYIGDDLNDYAAMRICGFKACPSDAAEEIKSIADYISSKPGGYGAVRDVLEHMLKKEGKWGGVLKIYGILKDCI